MKKYVHRRSFKKHAECGPLTVAQVGEIARLCRLRDRPMPLESELQRMRLADGLRFIKQLENNCYEGDDPLPHASIA